MASSFRNPDWDAITLHGYQSRWMPEELDPRYAPLREAVDATELLQVPTLLIQGDADRCDPPEESAGQGRYFTGGFERVVLDGVGHFPAREAPRAVTDSVIAHLDCADAGPPRDGGPDPRG